MKIDIDLTDNEINHFKARAHLSIKNHILTVLSLTPSEETVDKMWYRRTEDWKGITDILKIYKAFIKPDELRKIIQDQIVLAVHVVDPNLVNYTTLKKKNTDLTSYGLPCARPEGELIINNKVLTDKEAREHYRAEIGDLEEIIYKLKKWKGLSKEEKKLVSKIVEMENRKRKSC